MVTRLLTLGLGLAVVGGLIKEALVVGLGALRLIVRLWV